MLTIAQFVVLPLALGSVALVLFLGLANMARGGSPLLSQKLMRWRVILQFVAVCLVLATIVMMNQG
ncbi:twin transmembrane helix small protein [Bosea sp. 117]|uniref:twin transmembrane helix small protein n=1 Tax=Bosea sp. 117 TaxID=1125973 RepID=UPI000494831C|nr:twin transmembrane helix small protein [Bosea sp. 117]